MLRRALVVSIGSGVKLDSISTIKAVLIAENRPAFHEVSDLRVHLWLRMDVQR